jgi:hypothetical protein
MTKSCDHMIEAQHMASCDLAPFLFHMEDPEPQFTQHDLMLSNLHQSEAHLSVKCTYTTQATQRRLEG